MSRLEWLNQLPAEEARRELAICCGASAWTASMASRRPYASAEALFAAAEQCFATLGEADWREAFSHHPMIGDVEGLRAKYASNRSWSAQEQAGATAAAEETLHALAEGNRAYRDRFGHIFIVFATGKSADEMLALLRARIDNDGPTELRNAAREQQKITRLRLEKLLSP